MGQFADLFEGIEGFEWDEGNAEKNWRRHDVSQPECEQVFFNRPLVVAPDTGHSASERRLFVLGRTDTSRDLMVVFTIRDKLIRVISARPMSRRERREYARAQTKQA